MTNFYIVKNEFEIIIWEILFDSKSKDDDNNLYREHFQENQRSDKSKSTVRHVSKREKRDEGGESIL